MIRQLAFFGDSLTVGTVSSESYRQGGLGNFVELVGDRLANIVGIGPLISEGFQLATANSMFTYTGSFTATTTADAFDLLPYGHNGGYANGVANTILWTKPTQWRNTPVGHAIYFVDYTGGGNWQYSLDGGTTWANHGQTLTHGNRLVKFYITTAATTVKFRAFDGSADCGMFIAGIEPFWQDPVANPNGLIVHNYAVGGTQLHELVASGSAGDRMAIADAVVLGTGSPITNQANVLTYVMHINDTTLNNTTTWANDLTTFRNRMNFAGPIPVLFAAPWEGNVAAGTTVQGSYRTTMSTTAAGFSPAEPFLNFNTQWISNGWSTYTLSAAAGLLDNIPLHLSQNGDLDIAPRLYWFIRTQLLSVGNAPSTYTAAGKQPAVQYLGKRAAVQYLAGTPISVA